ncbi:hypothetical protein CV685_05030 [Borreliella burgdorferi]|nr:hypothetical protein CV664_04805 [Borreliella burgdorferi]PRR41669.1 hypothetical protein CV685_05030 [Borreliella burgdorferi]PRR60438.1 hypothetical protein CV639_05100 [Borreliella burgdorferi]PRR63132.1 hypothetical protein CV635_05860 [Borreliella burgdorferi]PRR67716.1 hypothetical protein CV636_04590 [Borreliella burgdorferi]
MVYYKLVRLYARIAVIISNEVGLREISLKEISLSPISIWCNINFPNLRFIYIFFSFNCSLGL